MFLDDYIDDFSGDALVGPETQVVPQEEPAETRRPRRILVVDDDVTQTEFLSFRFRQQGFEVAVAHSGEAALEAVQTSRPDLILLDIQLPGLDGLSVCQRLSDEPATCDIPVIILSGTERQEVIRKSRSAGCRYFVGKPYDPNALLVLAESALMDSGDW